MKPLVFLSLFIAPLLTYAGDVRIGDSLAAVTAALGAPRSQIQFGDKQILSYDRGQVRLVDGRVTEVDLVASNVLAAQQRDQDKDEQERAERAAVQKGAQDIADKSYNRHLRQIAAGLAIDQRLADAKQTAAAQLANVKQQADSELQNAEAMAASTYSTNSAAYAQATAIASDRDRTEIASAQKAYDNAVVAAKKEHDDAIERAVVENQKEDAAAQKEDEQTH